MQQEKQESAAEFGRRRPLPRPWEAPLSVAVPDAELDEAGRDERAAKLEHQLPLTSRIKVAGDVERRQAFSKAEKARGNLLDVATSVHLGVELHFRGDDVAHGLSHSLQRFG